MQENFTTVAIVCYRYERLTILQSIFAIILLWRATEDVEKLLKKLFTSKIKKKKGEAETKSSVLDLKNT